MPKKQWTPEERKAFGDKMRALKEKKNEEQAQTPVVDQPAQSNPVDPGNIQSPEVEELTRMVKELQAAMWAQSQGQTQSGAQATGRGLIGTFEKYKTDPNYYPDPRPQLFKEPRLQRFAFDMNYELEWEVNESSYKTIDGINQKEPRFNIALIRIIIDEDTGEPTNGRYTVCRAVFHEDPEAAVVVARENGLQVDEENEKEFLDSMRYLRVRDWLLEAFYPPAPNQEKKNKREMVINGKLVEYFEVNSETTETIPFGNLKSKI